MSILDIPKIQYGIRAAMISNGLVSKQGGRRLLQRHTKIQLIILYIQNLSFRHVPKSSYRKSCNNNVKNDQLCIQMNCVSILYVFLVAMLVWTKQRTYRESRLSDGDHMVNVVCAMCSGFKLGLSQTNWLVFWSK